MDELSKNPDNNINIIENNEDKKQENNIEIKDDKIDNEEKPLGNSTQMHEEKENNDIIEKEKNEIKDNAKDINTEKNINNITGINKEDTNLLASKKEDENIDMKEQEKKEEQQEENKKEEINNEEKEKLKDNDIKKKEEEIIINMNEENINIIDKDQKYDVGIEKEEIKQSYDEKKINKNNKNNIILNNDELQILFDEMNNYVHDNIESENFIGKEIEEDNELANHIIEIDELKNKELEDKALMKNEESDIRKFFEREEEKKRKRKIEEYCKKIDNLLDSINKDWESNDRNNYVTKYEYRYINEMNELFHKMDEDISIKDVIVCKIFKFICDYFHGRKDFLNEVPWVEMNNIRKILIKDNFENVCILKDNNLLIKQYEELIQFYNIVNKDENIIEYNNNIFVKYLIEFFFRSGFFEEYIDKVYTRNDEIFFGQMENNSLIDEASFFFGDFINIICYPIEAFSYCKKEYLIKMNYKEKFMSKFLMKLESIMKSTALKDEFKKQFYTSIIEKYQNLIENIFNNFEDAKEKNIPLWEKFTSYVLIIAESYLTQQKLENRIYGLNLITQLTDVLKNENKSPEYAKATSFLKESIIKYMTKINIYNLLFGENIHEALVHRSYNILSYLYKNNAFSQEQIKHLWNLSQDKYQTISDSIIELFGKLLPEFSTNDSNEILKIVSEMNLSEVNEVTLKLLENFFNSKEKNEKLYKILYKFSDELTLNEGLNKNIIIKSRSILVKLLFNQNYTKDLIYIIKKCIFNIGKNYISNTSLSILGLILEQFSKRDNSPEVRKIYNEINPNIYDLELLVKYLEKKGNMFSVLFTMILDNSMLIQFLSEETKNLNQLINNNDNFDSELTSKLDEMYKKFINPDNGYYYNYGLNGHIQGQINNNQIRHISINLLDKTQSTEKSLNEGQIADEEENDLNIQNIINDNNEDIFNNDEGNWEFEINPEKYFKNIFKEYILFIKKVSQKKNVIMLPENDLIELVYNQFEFFFTKRNYYQSISDLLEIIILFFKMGRAQIQLGYFKYLYEITINNNFSSQGKVIYFKFLNDVLKKQSENQNILLISDKVLIELVLDKQIKYDSSGINQLPYEAFEFFKQFFIYFNQKHGNIYLNANKKIVSIQKYELLAGIHILENYFIYIKDDKIYNESFELLTNILSIACEYLSNRKKILDKIFNFLQNNLELIKTDNEAKIQIIRELKLISIINSIKVKNFNDEDEPKNIIQINICNNFTNKEGEIEKLSVSKKIKIKELKNEILNKIILSEKNINLYNKQNQLEGLTLFFTADDIRQEVNKVGLNLLYQNQVLNNDYALDDYNVQNDEILVVEKNKQKINTNYEFQISDAELKEKCEQIKGIFSNFDDEMIKLSIKKNRGDTEETIMFLTNETNIEILKKEIEENKKKEKIEVKKKEKKEEESIIPLEEEKINLLFELLNQEDNLINEEIWKLLGSIKYPDSIINKSTGEELMNILSEPNLYKMLLNIKLVNSLVFDDNFCKFNKISPEQKLNWTSKFIKNESFVNSILNKLNYIGEIKEKNEIIEIKDSNENKDKKIGEQQFIKFQIMSIFTNWLHNIFINMLDFIKNEYIQLIINDIKQSNVFTLNNQNNNSINNRNHENNINNANNNNNEASLKIESINEKDAKDFIKILNKNNIVKLLYKIIKISIILAKDYKNIIQLILEIIMIYFSINRNSVKLFLEEETKNEILAHIIASDKYKDIRMIILNFFKIIIKNFNNFEKIEKIESIKSEKIINQNINNIKKDEENIELNNSEKLTDINEINTQSANENKKEEEKNQSNQDINNNKKSKNEVYNINGINENNNQEPALLPNQNEIKSGANDSKNEKENEMQDTEEISDDNGKMIHEILLNQYKNKVISEELFCQEFYVLYAFLLNFKEIKFSEDDKDKDNFIISQEISFLIKIINKNSILNGEEFIQKKYNIMYDIYLLSSCCKFYSPLIKYHMEKNADINLINVIYDCLFEVIKTKNNITSYKFDWDNLRKHSYNLLSNIIFLDNKYSNIILSKIFNHHKSISKNKLQISIDFKLRDPIFDKLIGLKNFGATCYLNSLFQQMYMNPLFSKDLLSFPYQPNKNLEHSVLYNMQLSFANLKYSCLAVYPPLEFIKSFKKAFNGEPIQFGVQQDSDEFLSILCDELEKEAKIFNKENFLNNSFKGQISNEIVSLDKEYPFYSKTDEDFYRVTLDIKGHKTLEEALDAYIKGEILDGDNQYYVDKYKKKLTIRKSSSLKKLGNQVIIHLKRFEFDFVTFTNKKLNDYLKFPFEINFKKWTRAYLRSSDPNLKNEILNITEEEKENLDQEKMNYVLTGILIHSGSSLQSGHYYSLIIDQNNGKWYQFNDNNITEFNIERDLEKECFGLKETNEREQFGRTAYLLFYTKKSMFRNEKIMKEININENIINEVYKQNIKYLGIKTYSNDVYQEFIIKLMNNCFKYFKDSNNIKEYSINKTLRKNIELYNEIKKQKNKIFEDINKIDDEEQKIISKNDSIIIPDNIEDIINNLNEKKYKENKDKIKPFTNKKAIKSLIYYTFDIATKYLNSNAKISHLLNTINGYISKNSIYCISILKSLEKYTDEILDYIFICGVKNQDMQNISKEIFDFFKNLFENVYRYEKENLKIISNKFNYISKNPDTKKYEILQEYESCLFRYVKKLFCKNLEKCRTSYSKDLMFLHLFRFCTASFPEISIILEDYLISLISFITNNKLKEPYLRSKKNPNFYMGGNPNWRVNENYEIIFCDIIIHSINDGMYKKKKLSPYFIKENQYYNINKKEEINHEDMFEYYPRLPKNISAMLSSEFIFDFLNSKNCTNEVIGNLCYENESFSNTLFKRFNNYLRDLHKNNLFVFENIFNKIFSIFKMEDSLHNQRLEILFELNSNNNNNNNLSLFDFFNNVKDQTESVLDFIYMLSSAMFEYNILYEYLYKYKSKINWIYDYFIKIKNEKTSNIYYNKIYSIHQEFIEIIEEGLINRLELAPKIDESNKENIGDNNNAYDNIGNDDDEGFNLI